MLSYRHAFHCGNFADVHKHMALCLLLRALRQKDKPFVIIDTHAGAGLYRLRDPLTREHGETAGGVEKIYDHAPLRELVPEYYRTLRRAECEIPPPCYPGSPYFIDTQLRPGDRLIACELHPADSRILQGTFARRGNRVKVIYGDGLTALKALLPPKPRRGLVFIDPPYEERDEYRRIAEAIKLGIKRWPTGIFAMWYPRLDAPRDEGPQLVDEIMRLRQPLLQTELHLTPREDQRGMRGSGLLVINYPYGLPEGLQEVTAVLGKALSADAPATRVQVLNPRP